MGTPLYLSRKTLAANQWSITATIDGATHTAYVAAGSYYLDGADADSLCHAVWHVFDDNWAGENFTVGYSTTTGLIAFACTSLGGTWEVAFDQLEFANWMGFAAAGTAWAATATTPQASAVVCAGQIFAGSGRAAFPGIQRRSSSASIVSESGVTAHIGSGAIRRYSSWQHGFEAHAFVASPLESGVQDDSGATTAWSWADFWAYHAQYGEPFRYFTSTGLSAGGFEDAYVLDAQTAAAFEPQRVEEASNKYWQVSLGVNKWVTAT